ncbi:carbohydrate binding domain-containing protein [Paenibacillus sp. P25]|nr:carbohydrate binding domain-containing protein [Paenibacillus sp. P25]
MGVYPEGALFEYDMKSPPGAENPKKTLVLEEQQERLVNMTSGGGKLYIATIPTYGTLGGAMTVYDPAKGGHEVYRNIVQDQSLLSLAYLDGKVFGSTTIRGGLGSLPTAEEAKIFVWDSVTKQKITEFPLRVPGLDKPIFIGDLSVGPDGLIWGAAYEYIFALDPKTYQIVKSKKIYPSLNYSQWAHHSMRWSKDGLLYVLFNNKLTVIDPETLESRTITDASRFELGLDGNLYFTDSATNTVLYRIQVDGETKEPPAGIPVPVSNPGFEETASGSTVPGWTSLFATGTDKTFEISSTRSYSGSKSLKLIDRSRNASVALQSDKIPVTAGKNYTSSVQIYIESGQPSVMLRFFDSKNATITTLEKHLDQSRLGQWQTVTLSGPAPGNAAYARLIAVTTSYNIAEAYYDDFSFTVQDTQAPVTTATYSPAPNAAGWVNRDVEVSLQAKDDGGTGVSSVTYSASGAFTLQPVTVPSSSAAFTISAEGVTAVTYMSEDRAYNKETPHTFEVKIDKTAPALSFTGSNKFTVDQLVTIGCQASDSVSGLEGNPCAGALIDRPAYDLNPGSSSVTVKARDQAGNTNAKTFTFNVSATYDSLCVLAKRFTVSDTGVGEAICAQLTAAKKAEERGAWKGNGPSCPPCKRRSLRSAAKSPPRRRRIFS